MSRPTLPLATLLLLACSGDSASRTSTAPDPVASTATTETTTAAPDTEESLAPEPKAAAAPRDDRAAPVGDDYIMSHTDCEALAQSYRRAWHRDETKKRAKVIEKSGGSGLSANIENAANEGAENWLASCRGIVGSPQVRSNLKCALKAKSIERFEACMSGQTGSAP